MTDEAVKARRSKASWATIVIAVVAGVGALVLARSFLMPVFLAFLLSLTFSPVRRWAAKRGIAAPVTSALVVGGLLFATAALVYLLSGPVQTYAEQSRFIAAEAERKLRGISEALETVSEAGEQVERIAAPDDTPGTTEVVVQEGPGLLSRIALGAPSILAQVVFTLVLLFFLIASGDLFYEKLVQANPRFSDKRRAVQIVFDIERKLSRYFFTITVINAGLGLVVGLTLWAIGMPNPLLFGVMAFVLNFIPYIGALAGVAITSAIGIVALDTVGQAALAGGVYLALTSLEEQLVTPYAVGRRLKMNPVLVFLAVAFWGWAWSFIGMFIAVPALIALRVVCEHVPGLSNLGLFLSGQDDAPEEQPSTPPGAGRA